MVMSDKLPPKDFLNSLEQSQKRRASNKGLKVFLWLFVCLALAGGSGTYYFYTKYQALNQNPTISSQKDLDKTLAAVNALMVLPTDEVPTLATILDKDKLTNQAFFAQAQNGDKLLAYTKSLQAILYRPSTNKIIKVAPIYFNTDTLDQAAGDTGVGEEPLVVEESTSALRVAYYNGTLTPNLSQSTEKKVLDAFPDYTTVTVENATQSNYITTVVVDISGKHSAEAASLATLLGAEVRALPENEVVPDADLLIISAE